MIYAAPTWDILREVIAKIECSGFKVPWVVLYPRPAERCGELDEPWREYEQRGCSILAKGRLCRERCRHYTTCDWPEQLDRIAGIRLVIMTEKRLELVRTIVALLQARTRGPRTLVILDEARSLDADFDVTIGRDEVDRFREAVMRVRCRKMDWPATREIWVRELDALLRSTAAEFEQGGLVFLNTLGKFAFGIQAWGWAKYEQEFRYLGYDLPLLNLSRDGERWIEEDEFHFIARPYLRCHLLLLSAHLTGAYAGHRLGEGPIPSPFEDIRFVHTKTHIINIRNRCGADRHFASNRVRILDTFAVVILRNVLERRTTLLVSKKRSKQLCADYLTRRLAGWGLAVRCVLDGEPLPMVPDPRVIPIIHYGVLGVNDYTDYETCYCLNSYYIRSSELNRTVQEFEPRHFRTELEIVTTPDRRREVRVPTTDATDAERAWLGEVYLRKLEVDPVIQAAGRVRFVTKPREVVFFQMDDMERDLGPIQEVDSLAELRDTLGVPSAREIDDAADGRRAAELMAQGNTAAEAAQIMGISRETLFRRLRAAESVKFHKKLSLRDSDTPPPFSGSPEGVS